MQARGSRAIELPEAPDLPAELDRLLRQIPAGRVATCGGLAKALGDVVAARWVGHYLAVHRHDAACPCHRVLLAGGVLGRYLGRPHGDKAARLAAEGVAIVDGKADLAAVGFDDFASDRPLARLAEVQRRLAERVRLAPPRRPPRLVAGVDTSYIDEHHGVAAMVIHDCEAGRTVWSTTMERRVPFPYITSYLTFREMPLYVALIEKARRAGHTPDALLVDGSGRLHQRHAGIAAHVGVIVDLPTVGVAKSLLWGRPLQTDLAAGESCPVLVDDEAVGIAFRAGRSRRPLYISPGHRVNLAYAEATVRATLGGRRLPAPLYAADRLSRQMAAARRAERLLQNAKCE